MLEISRQKCAADFKATFKDETLLQIHVFYKAKLKNELITIQFAYPKCIIS